MDSDLQRETGTHRGFASDHQVLAITQQPSLEYLQIRGTNQPTLSERLGYLAALIRLCGRSLRTSVAGDLTLHETKSGAA